MFTLVIIYIYIYILILLNLFFLNFIQIPIRFLTSCSLPNYILFVKKYKNFNKVYNWLFFSLTGLPPFGLFFIKFNLFFLFFNNTHILISFFIFLFFFLNMIYYCQIFNFKNFKKPIYNIIKKNTINIKDENLSKINIYSKYYLYYYSYFSILILFFIFFTVFFFTDYYIIFYI